MFGRQVYGGLKNLRLFSRTMSTVKVRAVIEKRYEELCRRFESGDPESVAQMYTPNCQLLTYGEPPIYGREDVKKFSGGFMGDKMDVMRIQVLDVVCGENNMVADHHSNVTTKTNPDGSVTKLSSKDIVVWKYLDGEWLLHVDIYTPDPGQNTVQIEQKDSVANLTPTNPEDSNGMKGGTSVAELSALFSELYNKQQYMALSELYTENCRVLMDDMFLKKNRSGCAEAYSLLSNRGVTRIEMESNVTEVLGDNLVFVTGPIKMFRDQAGNTGGTSPVIGKYLRIFKRVDDGRWYIHWECTNSDS